MDAPILCTLSPADLQQRKTAILASLRARVIGRQPIAGGYRYEFVNEPTTFQEVSRIAELERQCCRFLSFDVVESETRVRLDVTGPPKALAVIEDLFG